MADAIVVRLEGAKALRKQLRRLGDAGTEIIADAVNAAGAMVLREYRSRAPRKRGVLAGSFKLRRASKSRKSSLFRKGVVRAHVGTTRAGLHARNVEFGHRIVRNGRVVGQASPHPFMRPAFDAVLNRLVRVQERVIGAGIDRAIR